MVFLGIFSIWQDTPWYLVFDIIMWSIDGISRYIQYSVFSIQVWVYLGIFSIWQDTPSGPTAAVRPSKLIREACPASHKSTCWSWWCWWSCWCWCWFRWSWSAKSQLISGPVSWLERPARRHTSQHVWSIISIFCQDIDIWYLVFSWWWWSQWSRWSVSWLERPVRRHTSQHVDHDEYDDHDVDQDDNDDVDADADFHDRDQLKVS